MTTFCVSRNTKFCKSTGPALRQGKLKKPRRLQGLGGEFAQAEGDGNADEEHVHEKALEELAMLVGPDGVEPTKGQDNQVHHEEYGNAVKDAANEEVRFEEVEFPTSQAIDSRGGEGNVIVQEDAEEPDASTALKCLPPKQASGDGARHTPTVSDERGSQIERAGNESTNKYGNV